MLLQIMYPNALMQSVYGSIANRHPRTNHAACRAPSASKAAQQDAWCVDVLYFGWNPSSDSDRIYMDFGLPQQGCWCCKMYFGGLYSVQAHMCRRYTRFPKRPWCYLVTVHRVAGPAKVGGCSSLSECGVIFLLNNWSDASPVSMPWPFCVLSVPLVMVVFSAHYHLFPPPPSTMPAIRLQI
jgi:hypothetical protein